MLLSGNLKERISFKRPVRTPNNSGGTTTTFDVPYLSTFSNVSQLKASNDLIASKADIIQPYQFTIRYRLDPVIKIADVITHRDRDFEILSFESDPSRTWITIIGKTSRNGSI